MYTEFERLLLYNIEKYINISLAVAHKRHIYRSGLSRVNVKRWILYIIANYKGYEIKTIPDKLYTSTQLLIIRNMCTWIWEEAAMKIDKNK